MIKPEERLRLAKFVANCGVGSRRKSEEIIAANLVRVNGAVIFDPAHNVESEDIVVYNGKELKLPETKYIALNKPRGYTTTTRDRFAKKIITELVPPGLLPVGRLDKETSGIIFFTNDGDLINKLTHPRFGHKKEYLATTRIALSDSEIKKIKEGIKLEDGLIEPDLFESLGDNVYRVIIHEGRNRIVRRMFDYFNKPLVTLVRISFSGISLDGIEEGHWRNLTKDEVHELMK